MVLLRIHNNKITFSVQVPPCQGNSRSKFAYQNTSISNRCEGCLRLISFLNAEDQETLIQVNQTLRNCVRSCLQRTPPGQTKNLKTILQIRDSELTPEQTKNRLGGGKNCGSTLLKKVGAPEDDAQQERKK